MLRRVALRAAAAAGVAGAATAAAAAAWSPRPASGSGPSTSGSGPSTSGSGPSTPGSGPSTPFGGTDQHDLPSSPRSTTPKSPFVYPELEEGIRARTTQERRLRRYVAEVGPVVSAARAELDRAARQGDEAAMARARDRLDVLATRVRSEPSPCLCFARTLPFETASLTWGSPRGESERATFVERYGCTAWTSEALDAIAAHSPIVEMGAGRGQWARALTEERGADVLAFDNFSALPGGRHPALDTTTVARVRRGDERALGSWRVRFARPRRTLLVVYPQGDLLRRCVERYDGDVLLFVGEGRGGVNGGDDRVFDILEREWAVERVVRVRPFRGGHERLWVLRRRRKDVRGKGEDGEAVRGDDAQENENAQRSS